VDVFEADGTVFAGHAFNAVVFSTGHVNRQAHIALVAVEVVGCFAHSADATTFAVVLVPVEVVIEELTLKAAVSPKCDPASLARSLKFLPKITVGTDHFSNGEPVQYMVLCFVMAKPTPINLPATWAHKLTFSLVMSAGKTFVDYSNFVWFFVGSRLGCRVVAHFTWKLEQQV